MHLSHLTDFNDLLLHSMNNNKAARPEKWMSSCCLKARLTVTADTQWQWAPGWPPTGEVSVGSVRLLAGPTPHVPGQVWSLLTLTRPSDRTRAIRSSAHGAFLPLLFVLFFKKKKLYICFVWSLLLVANRDERKERFRFACFLKRILF